VLGGGDSDIGTVARGLRDRQIPEKYRTLESINKSIDREVKSPEIITDAWGKKEKRRFS
jgi:hypothetical protein